MGERSGVLASQARRAFEPEPPDHGSGTRATAWAAMTVARSDSSVRSPRSLVRCESLLRGRWSKRIFVLLIVIGGVLASSCSPSPPPAPPAPTPSPVDELIEAHLAARGGKDKLRALRSIRETGTVTASDG